MNSLEVNRQNFSRNSYSQNKREYFSVDVARLFCALGIVAFHVFEGTISHFDLWWQVPYFMLTRISVPFFCVASGFFFFNKAESIGIKKLLHFEVRMIKLLVLWSLAYFPLKISEFLQDGARFSVKVLWFYVVSFFREGGYYHLWYMIGIILAVPIAALLLRRKYYEVIFALSVTLILFGTVLDVLLHTQSNNNIVNLLLEKYVLLFGNSTKNAFIYCLPYVCIGGVISKLEIKKKIEEKRTILLGLSVILYAIEVFTLTNSHIVHLNMFFFVNLTVSFGFCSLLSMPCPEISSKRIRLISEYVYFIHPMVIWIFRDLLGAKSYRLFFFTTSMSLFTAIVLSFIKGKKQKNEKSDVGLWH